MKVSTAVVGFFVLFFSISTKGYYIIRDDQFGTNGIVETRLGSRKNQFFAGALQSDDKIVMVGTVGDVVSTKDDVLVVRYNNDGSLDVSFGEGGFVRYGFGLLSVFARAIAIQDDGKIVIGGDRLDNEFFVARYNTDGTLDVDFGATGSTFTLLGGFPESVCCMEDLIIQPDGKIITVGSVKNSKGCSSVIIRYDSNGILDEDFGQSGSLVTNFGWNMSAVALQCDEKILIVGSHCNGDSNCDIGMVRFHKDGLLDTDFGESGSVMTKFGPGVDQAYDLVVCPDDKLVVVGDSCSETGTQFFAVRYTTDGLLDLSFGIRGRFSDNVGFGNENVHARSVALQQDGKIVVGGYGGMDGYQGAPNQFLLVRLTQDGFFDEVALALDLGITVTSLQGFELLIQNNGGFVLGGYDDYAETAVVAKYKEVYPEGGNSVSIDSLEDVYESPHSYDLLKKKLITIGLAAGCTVLVSSLLFYMWYKYQRTYHI